MRVQRVRLAAGEMWYLEEGDGESLLFLHGAFATSEAYMPLLTKLSHAYHVIAPIHPGHGKSFGIPRDWKLNNYVSFYENFFADIGFIPRYLIGHSFGGTMALLLASRGTGKQVVVFDAPALPYTMTIAQYASVLNEERQDLLAKRSDLSHTAEAAKVAGSVVESIFFHPNDLLRLMDSGLKYNIASYMKHISIPVDLFWGNNDRVVPVEVGEKLHLEIPSSRLTILPNRGHNYCVTDSEFAYELIQKALHSKY
jgi:pimeloyl-ACP methyl ester carboxylesterase